MKQSIMSVMAAACLMASCQADEHAQSQSAVQKATSSADYFIQADTANYMIKSYLQSINYQVNDTDLHSLIINADALRAYLGGGEVSALKVMFAHTPDFIRMNGFGADAGYKSGGLTIVLAGIDDEGNYYLMNGDEALNKAIPCPTNCPQEGTAASDTLVVL